jgi:hypothetical protein
MKLDPKIVEAAMWPITNWKQREARARRVILALAEEMPADAVMEATFVLLGAGVSFSPIEGIAVHIRAAIIAALRKMAEE